MDQTKKSLPDVIRKDFLTCKVCYELYKSPKLLPCLHSYCLQCLQRMEKNGFLYCPECRLKVNINGSVSSLRTNFFINSLLEVFISKPVLIQVCTKCCSAAKSLPAICHCLDCAEFLCSSCSKGHRNHKLRDLQDSQMAATPAKGVHLPVTYCSKHKDAAVGFFCNTCSVHICKACCQQGHLKHDIVPMTDAEQTKPEMSKLIYNLEMNISKIGERKKEIADQLAALKAADESVRLSVMGSINKVTAHLLKLKDATYNTLDLLQKKNLEKYTSLEQELQSQSDRAISTRDFSFKIMEMVQGSDKACMEALMRDWVQGLRVCLAKQLELQTPKLIPVLDAKDVRNIKLFDLQIAESKHEGSAAPESDTEIRETGAFLPTGNCIGEEAGLPADPTTGRLSTLCGASADCLPSVPASAVDDSLRTGNNAAAAQSMEGTPARRGSRGSLLAGSDSDSRHLFSNEARRVFYEAWSDDSDVFNACRCYDSDCSFEGYWLEDSFDDSDLTFSSSENETDWVLSREPPPANTATEQVCSFHVNQRSSSSGVPKITGIACFHSGEIIMADGKQDDLKVFTASGSFSKCFILPVLRGQPPPCGVAVCGEFLLCSAGCYLIFMTLWGKMRHNVKLRGNQSQYPIASYKSEYVAVSEGTHCSIALYEMSGQCLGRVSPSGYEGGKFLFVAVNSQEVFIVSDFLKKNIVVFHKSGDVINVLDASTPLVRDPFCICIADDDHFFVVDQGRVLEFTPNGGFGRLVLREEKVSHYPRVIAVDNHRRLIVVQRKNNANIIQL